ncbi:Polynucleotidyl transferase, ribonuclease H superfamily protein [Trifolium repens]|nr:Polynucleotidyl transferase, ribonuclease H superfamily protein [Trifolium repens]
MNQACILKWGWKMLLNPNEMWCNVLKGKYGRQGTIFERSKPIDSTLWKAIVRLAPHLENYCFWVVNDGHSVSALHQAWITPGVLLADMNLNIPNELHGATVADLVDSTGDWNWSLFNDWLPTELKLRMLSIPPPHDNNGADVMKGANKYGNDYAVAEMYDILSEFQHMEINFLWRKIWKLHVAERVRSFIWLVLHERLLTNYRKSKMGMGHAMCNYCGDIIETELHVLRDCPLVMPIWLNVVDDRMRSSFFVGELKQWITLNLTSLKKWNNDVDWKDFWATACHFIWYWRNKAEHDDHFQRPQNPIMVITDRVQQYKHAEMLGTVMQQTTRAEIMVCWKPPMEGWVKLNRDGAYKDGSAAGCGGVIRDSHGGWIGGFAKYLGICSAYVAELWGVLEGLRYARNLGFTRIELNVDSSVVDHVLRRQGNNSPTGSALINQIRRLMDLDWEVVVKHSYREANKCADVLANIGCTLDSHIMYYESCPSECHLVWSADVLGIATPRLIPV